MVPDEVFNPATLTHMQDIFNDVKDERHAQFADHSDGFDAQNTPSDWIAAIVYHLGKAVTYKWNPIDFRTALVKVATLCFAAIEWCDRVGGNMPPRHYD